MHSLLGLLEGADTPPQGGVAIKLIPPIRNQIWPWGITQRAPSPLNQLAYAGYENNINNAIVAANHTQSYLGQSNHCRAVFTEKNCIVGSHNSTRGAVAAGQRQHSNSGSSNGHMHTIKDNICVFPTHQGEWHRSHMRHSPRSVSLGVMTHIVRYNRGISFFANNQRQGEYSCVAAQRKYYFSLEILEIYLFIVSQQSVSESIFLYQSLRSIQRLMLRSIQRSIFQRSTSRIDT